MLVLTVFEPFRTAGLWTFCFFGTQPMWHICICIYAKVTTTSLSYFTVIFVYHETQQTYQYLSSLMMLSPLVYLIPVVTAKHFPTYGAFLPPPPPPPHPAPLFPGAPQIGLGALRCCCCSQSKVSWQASSADSGGIPALPPFHHHPTSCHQTYITKRHLYWYNKINQSSKRIYKTVIR